MNKTLTPKEVSELLDTVALGAVTIPKPMTRKQKLAHWAKAVACHYDPIRMGTGLEYMHWDDLNRATLPGSIYDVAAKDPVLQAEGLTSNTIGASVKFFQLTQNEVHFLSCDCHGRISNGRMGEFIAHLIDCDFGPRF